MCITMLRQVVATVALAQHVRDGCLIAMRTTACGCGQSKSSLRRLTSIASSQSVAPAWKSWASTVHPNTATGPGPISASSSTSRDHGGIAAGSGLRAVQAAWRMRGSASDDNNQVRHTRCLKREGCLFTGGGLSPTASSAVLGIVVNICWQTHGGDAAPSWGDIGPLHAACFNGDTAAVRVLLEGGADVDAVVYSAARTTPLHEACLGGHDAVVR